MELSNSTKLQLRPPQLSLRNTKRISGMPSILSVSKTGSSDSSGTCSFCRTLSSPAAVLNKELSHLIEKTQFQSVIDVLKFYLPKEREDPMLSKTYEATAFWSVD